MKGTVFVSLAFAGIACAGGQQADKGTGVAPLPSAAATTVPAAPPELACEALTTLALPHVTVTSATVVPAAAATDRTPALPSYCRVVATSRPTSDSDIGIEVAIPEGAAWSGRYEQVGNGGFAGAIPASALVTALARGSATAGTDDGHRGGQGDAGWALGHPQKVIDFGYRALKETTEVARAVIKAHTGRPARFSYFVGCSMGGREAMVEAQRYPEDFDGIVAGAPAFDTVHFAFTTAWNALAMMKSTDSFLPPAKLKTIETAALRACGDADGVIEDPPSCHFDPASLRCRGRETRECLTVAQLTTLAAIYRGAHNPRTEEAIYPGFEPGAEAEPEGWAGSIVSENPANKNDSGDHDFAAGFFRFIAFSDPSYDLRRLDFDHLVARVDTELGATLAAYDPDLTAFKKRGGKLLHVHGWEDPAVAPRASVRYFDRVQATMGDTADFYRLFMEPGVLHCGGGRGPDVVPLREAITSWVERGIAPDRLIATKYEGGDETRPVLRARPLCPYPRHAVAKTGGSDDPRSAEAYTCVPPSPPTLGR